MAPTKRSQFIVNVMKSIQIAKRWEPMSATRSFVDRKVNWIAANARSFSYLLPDTLELTLYLALAAYFTLQLAQQQA